MAQVGHARRGRRGDLGACQGSGSKPYQVQIDLAEPAFKCSCPSRKFPCKHALGLLLIHATTPAAIVKAERPAWVSEWLASREAPCRQSDRETSQTHRRRAIPKLRQSGAASASKALARGWAS